MKLIYSKIFGSMAGAMLLFATSCQDDTFKTFWDDDSDEYTVTLNVSLEQMSPATRDSEENGEWEFTPKIGTGSKADMLVYAVYYDNNVAQGITSATPDWVAATEYAMKDDTFTFNKGSEEEKEITVGHGQTIVDVSEYLMVGKPYPITLTLKKGQQYQVVFWAQNHNTDAFVIDDLKKVQMKYKLMTPEDVTDEKGKTETKDKIFSINNDETRDAFCRSIPLDGAKAQSNITIYLKRPLAQINVGTRGFDYESITRNAQNNKKYRFSKIRINRAARYYNAVEDYTYTSTTTEPSYDDPDPSTTEAFYTIDYEYNKIPAYWNMDEIPEYPSYTMFDKTINKEKKGYAVFESLHKELAEKYDDIYGKEEFLQVHLNLKDNSDPKKYHPYASMGSSLSYEDDMDTEVFKYLSMCYILTATDDSKSEVLNNVKVWLATDENGSNEVEIVNLNNVPVQRNHRTNIVGSLLTAKANMEIVVDEDFAGRKINDESDIVSGEIAEGFYYDAEKKEFQISSLNGLLFFQQLVNGDLTVRQITYNSDGDYVGDPYPYVERGAKSELRKSLKYKSWTYNELGQKKAQILLTALGLNSEEYKETSSDTNNKGKKFQKTVNDGKNSPYTVSVWLNGGNEEDKRWPKFNNFSFYGATVKLMADIDLSGIEWIPIGFDCVNWDNSIGYKDEKAYQADDQISATNYRTLVKDNKGKITIFFEHRRVFAGTFDGNGHTIYNMTTKQFGSDVLDYNKQKPFSDSSSSAGPYDNVQWFGRGFFGLCGPNVVIKNLRLQNVNVHGNNGVAGIVAMVSSAGFPAKIDNCVVDGGYITGMTLYRNIQQDDDNYAGRSHARGVYIAGIVGQFCAYDKENAMENCEAGVTNCKVRNLVIQGFRRIGGVIGSIADQSETKMGNSLMRLDLKVEDNSVENTIILCNQYSLFNNILNEEENGVWKNGYGWNTGTNFAPLAGKIVGGRLDTEDVFDSDYVTNSKNNKEYFETYIPKKNYESNVQYSEISTRPNQTKSKLRNKPVNTVRESTIENIPLEYIPMFTSLYVDEVDLTNNYYGKANIRTKIDFSNVNPWQGTRGSKKDEFELPFIFPNGEGINYSEVKSMAGMYVESVYITGENNPTGKRSVVTPTGVDGENSCVMYVTARNRTQFKDKVYVAKNKDASPFTSSYTLNNTTTIKHMVLRGSPYAWAGIILAPNENMDEVILDNVTIYDVYKTLALEKEPGNGVADIQKLQNYTCFNGASVKLTATDCNFRGYTVPGAGWSKITYTNTTFESGAETGYSYTGKNKTPGNANKIDIEDNEFKTCKVEATTEFTNCYFKAPYYINLTPIREKKDSNIKVEFNNCYGTSAYENELIDPNKINTNVYFIGIDKNVADGKTVVTYYDENGKPIK